jgi:transcriptional regulator with XRE-family HTH domain
MLLAFGKTLRAARKKSGLTQAEVAEAAGLVQSYVFEIETRGANITLKTLYAIAATLRVSMKDLIPDNEFGSVNPGTVANLAAALIDVKAALEDRNKQEAKIVSHLDRISALSRLLEILVEERSPR